jgi:hypothetical protein
MMQYINRQKYLTGQERNRQNETRIQINQQSTSCERLANEIWGNRRPIKGKIGFCGGHIGTGIVEESTWKHQGRTVKNISTPFTRMFGRIALPFRYFYQQPAYKITPLRHDDKVPQLIAIGYDEWEWHST